VGATVNIISLELTTFMPEGAIVTAGFVAGTLIPTVLTGQPVEDATADVMNPVPVMVGL
jgi:hypothetical protein